MNKWKVLRNISAFIFCSAITAFILGLTLFKGFLNKKELLVLAILFVIFIIITYIFGDMAKREERKRRRQNRNKNSRLYKSKEDKKTKDNFTNSYMERVKDLEKSFMEIRQLADNTNDPMEKLMHLWKTLALYRQAKVFSYSQGDELINYFTNNWENQEDMSPDKISYEDRLLEDINTIENQIKLSKISKSNIIDEDTNTDEGKPYLPTEDEDLSEDNNIPLNTSETLNSFNFDDDFFDDFILKNNNKDDLLLNEDIKEVNDESLEEIKDEDNLILVNEDSEEDLQKDLSEDIDELDNLSKKILSFDIDLDKDSPISDDEEENITNILEDNSEIIKPLIDDDEDLFLNDIKIKTKDDIVEENSKLDDKPDWLKEYENFKNKETEKPKEKGVEDIIQSMSSEEDLLSIEDLISIDIFDKNITDIDEALMSKVDFIYRNIVFLNWCDKKGLGTDADFYPDEIRYDLNIFLPHNRHKKFISLGLLEKHTYKDMLNSFKVTELKEILRQNDLKVSGLKKDLVNRILKNTNLDDLKLTYTLSKKGKDLINRYYPFVKFYGRNDLNIPLDNFYLSWLKLEHSESYEETPPFIKIIVGAYRARAFEAAYKKMYSTLRAINDDIFDIVFNINGDEDFLQVVVDVICIDLCGLDDEAKIDIESIKLCDDYIKYFIRNSDLYDDSYVDRAFDNNNMNNYALIKDYIKGLLYSIIKRPDIVEDYLKDYKKALKARVEAVK